MQLLNSLKLLKKNWLQINTCKIHRYNSSEPRTSTDNSEVDSNNARFASNSAPRRTCSAEILSNSVRCLSFASATA